MNKDSIALVIIVLQIFKINVVETKEIPVYKIPNTAKHRHVLHPLQCFDHSNKSLCLSRNNFVDYSKNDENQKHPDKNFKAVKDKAYHVHNVNRINSILQHILLTKPSTAMNMSPRIISNNMMYPIQGPTYTTPSFAPVSSLNMLLNKNLYTFPPFYMQPSSRFTPIYSSMASFTHNVIFKPTLPVHHGMTDSPLLHQTPSFEKFARSLDLFEQKFYMVTFTKLISISPPDRQVNGMSFVQSGFFLHLTLMALTIEVDALTKAEIERTIGFRASDMEIKNIIRQLISTLPDNSEGLKFRRASRLVLWPGCDVSSQFRIGPAAALQLGLDTFNGTEKLEEIHNILNQKVNDCDPPNLLWATALLVSAATDDLETVSILSRARSLHLAYTKIETDSGGAIRDTFDEDDISNGVTAVMITTLYFRARWRGAPTVLNGTWPFHDADDAPERAVRMIKLNDIMGYADIKEWNAQALEIPYATPGLSLVIILPREPALRKLADYVIGISIKNVTSRMTKMRVAAIMPIYTLRMTLLLPNKLQAMGVSRLFNVSDIKPGDPLRLSHMVQRVMFWAEAGRNAYKDDGIEWDEKPDMQLLIDRPYIFFVRWRNVTLMNGNFVL